MEIPCPETFDFVATKWPEWKQCLMHIRSASDLLSKSVVQQLNVLIYYTGDKSADTF